jgi:hypothetical protein
VAAAARVAAPPAGRPQCLFASWRRAVRHRRAAIDGRAAGRARADASRAAYTRRAGRAASRRRSRAATRGPGRRRTGRARARRAARAAPGPGGRRVARAHLGPHRGSDHRPGRHRQDQGPGRHRRGMGWTGIRHRHLPERHQRTPPGRDPGSREHHPAARRHPAWPDPAALADRGRRRLHDLHHPPGRPHRIRRPQPLQARTRRRPGTARRRRRRRRQ